MADRDPRPLDELLAHTAWIRRVATSLVREPADIDDVVQGTLLAGLQHPPAPDSRLGAWLGSVARNLVRKRARGATRRTQRELDAPDYRDPALTPESLVERAELQHLIAAFVLDLSEPFRSTLLLHYFEELSPAEIAQREQIPAATVRSRLKRGLDELRARLDQEHGGKRRAWLAPVAALAAPRSGHVALTWKGLLIMKTKLTIATGIALALGALLLAGGTIAHRARWRSSPTTPASVAPVSTAATRATRARQKWMDPSEPARSAMDGIVRGPDGKPLAGALVGAVPEDSDADELHVHAVAFALSGADGRFRIASLRSGAYAAQATARGLSPAYRSGLVVLDGETVHVELRLDKGGVTITGQLRDAGGGTIAAGRLHARRHGEERPDVFTVACDAAGVCRSRSPRAAAIPSSPRPKATRRPKETSSR